MGALESNTTLVYGVHLRESANDGSDFSNAASDYRVLFLGEDGLLHVKDSSGTVDEPFTAGGGVTRSTLGTTSVGGSFATRGMYIKKITLATAGLLAGINCHIKGDGSNHLQSTGVLYSDSGGSPTNVLFWSHTTVNTTPTRLNGPTLNTTARWVTFPVGVWLAAGDYWIGIWFNDATGSAYSLAFASGSGSDRTVAGGTNNQPQDSSVQAISTGTNDYSIYADIIR